MAEERAEGRRRPGRRAARGREEVLAGASRVIARRGADATRYADVAAETGAAISTLQYSFGSRADLVIAALRETHRADVALVETALAGLEDPVQRLRTFVLNTVEFDADPETVREGWLVWVEFWRAGARDPELAAEWRAAYEDWVSVVEEIVTDGIAAGVFPSEQPPRAVAVQTLALLDGLGIPMVLRDPAMAPERMLATALAALATLLRCPALAA